MKKRVTSDTGDRTRPGAWRSAPGVGFESPTKVDYEDPSRDMVLVAVTGIDDFLRPGVREAVATTTPLVLPSRCAPGATSSPPTRLPVRYLHCWMYRHGAPVFRTLDPNECTEAVPVWF